MKKIIIIFSFFIFSNSFVGAQCIPNNAANDYISKAVAMVTYNNFQFTGFLVNNANEDGKLYFMTSFYPFNGTCGVSNTTSGHISNITFKWVDGSTTTGATLLAGSSSEVSLLELDNPPPFDSYSLLGFTNISSNISYCLSNYTGGSLKKLDVQSSSAAYVSTDCNIVGTNTYSFTNGINNDAYLVEKWSGNVNLEKTNYSKGAPLFNSSGQVVGLYVTKTIDTACGSESAYFLADPHNSGNILQTLGGAPLRGIKYTPCVDVKIEPDVFNSPEIVKANIRIIGSSKIDNVAVVFRAGEEVILENGFSSGNNFIAEIAPCFADVEEISAKTNDDNYSREIIDNLEVEKSKVKAFPTVMFNDKLTIESTNLESYDYIIYDISGKIIKRETNVTNSSVEVYLPEISKGIYFLNVNALNYSETVKLLKE